MADNAFQRVGAISNAHVGREFEELARGFLGREGLHLSSNFSVSLGVGSIKKIRRFDLGCGDPQTLVECKSHRWTAGNNVPSAKMTVWNESMYYFHLAPASYRKIMFVLRDLHARRRQSLTEYYIQNYGHLIPESVEFWEYDPSTSSTIRVK
jgi:hypothetical protein